MVDETKHRSLDFKVNKYKGENCLTGGIKSVGPWKMYKRDDLYRINGKITEKCNKCPAASTGFKKLETTINDISLQKNVEGILSH